MTFILKENEMDKRSSYGLTSDEVKIRQQQQQTNKVKKTTSRSYYQIFFFNIFTFFNLINCILFYLVSLTKSYYNGLFVLVVFSNVIINLFQEIRSKRTLDKLALLKVSKAKVYRNQVLVTIPIDQIVLDDFLLLENGDQVPSDARVIEGSLEINESLLTGEVDSIYKLPESELYSGSFVTSGQAVCQVTHVGEDNYIQKITKEAKAIKKQTYMIKDSLGKIIKWISIILVPLCSLLFVKQFFFSGVAFNKAILYTVAAAVGMFPEGLYLLTSVALTISAVYLAHKRVLVQELNCIDALARVDILCLDKTGTITEGKMVVEQTISLAPSVDVATIMGSMLAALPDKNPTAMALRLAFPENHALIPSEVTPFSSDRKYSCVTFADKGMYFLGATSFLLSENEAETLKLDKKYAHAGYRVLTLGHSNENTDHKTVKTITPIAMFLISDTVRENVIETLQFFKGQGVTCKIISGDDPATVSQIAKKVQLPGAEKYIDVSKLNETELKDAVINYQIFGRVTPQRKKEMVVALKSLGHTVAMTGDGVNDVLALKEANCSIAMASGVDAARQTSDIVLLDNQFNAIPDIMNEGRRVINNMTRAGALVLVQVIYSILLTTGTLIAGFSYPFEPIQLTIINACFVGIPSFLLNFELDFKRVKGEFLPTIFKKAFPPGLTIAIGTLLIINVGHFFGSSTKALSIMAILFTAWNYLLVQRNIYPPNTKYRLFIFLTTQTLYFIALIIGQDFLNLGNVTYINLILLVALLGYSIFFQKIFGSLLAKLSHRFKMKLALRQDTTQ